MRAAAVVRCIQAMLFLLPLTASAQTVIEFETLAQMPQALSNNAVTLTSDGERVRLYSFLGLTTGKSWEDIVRAAMVWDSDSGGWRKLPNVPVTQGRLAAAAVTVAGNVYLIGGYTVMPDGSEASTPEIFRLDAEGRLQNVSVMPVPVDDMVALVYKNRYIYLVSGWHDVGNVNLVQVFDTINSQWQQAEPWPGAPVFGHAGGISGSSMLICDGVKIVYASGVGPRQFLPSAECWLGLINANDVRRISWRQLDAHPGPPRYRMAATGADSRVVFVGGSANPYNYDGIGYDGAASEPIAGIFSFDLESGQWLCHGNAAIATMDHRALGEHAGWYYLAGGMLAGQQVSDQLVRFRVPKMPRSCQ